MHGVGPRAHLAAHVRGLVGRVAALAGVVRVADDQTVVVLRRRADRFAELRHLDRRGGGVEVFRRGDELPHRHRRPHAGRDARAGRRRHVGPPVVLGRHRLRGRGAAVFLRQLERLQVDVHGVAHLHRHHRRRRHRLRPAHIQVYPPPPPTLSSLLQPDPLCCPPAFALVRAAA